MARYVLDESSEPISEKQAKVLARIDSFISKYITELKPEELEQAIITYADPKQAWKSADFKRGLKSLVAFAKLMGGISSLLGGGTAYDWIKGYVTIDNMRQFSIRYAEDYPEHLKVVNDLAPQSYDYLCSSCHTLLRDLLD